MGRGWWFALDHSAFQQLGRAPRPIRGDYGDFNSGSTESGTAASLDACLSDASKGRKADPLRTGADMAHRPDMIPFAVSLVLGGTGMLAGATRWLAARSEKTILVARHATSFMATPGVVALDADWRSLSFAREIGAALKQSAPVEAALLWLHEPRPVLSWLLPELPLGRVVLVLGSMDGRPDVPDGATQIATVRLGSIRTAHGRRWLTHDEISAAAVASLQDGESRVVGDLAPTS